MVVAGDMVPAGARLATPDVHPALPCRANSLSCDGCCQSLTRQRILTIQTCMYENQYLIRMMNGYLPSFGKSYCCVSVLMSMKVRICFGVPLLANETNVN